MNEIDIAIIIVIGISLLIGLFRGFVKEIVSLFAWVIAIWVGISFSRGFSVLLETFIEIPAARIAAAFVMLVLLTLILSSVINYFVELAIEKTGLTVVDRVLGVLLGVARGVIVVALVVMLASMTPAQELSLWKQSALLPLFQTLASLLQELIPPDIAAI